MASLGTLPSPAKALDYGHISVLGSSAAALDWLRKRTEGG